MKYIHSFLLITFAMITNVAFAQTLRIGTGAADGTYSKMFNELKHVCGDSTMAEVKSTGSMDNITMLAGNQINLAIVQADVLSFRDRSDNLSTIKTLFAMHPEEVHFVSKANGGKEVGGMGFMGMKVGGSVQVFNSIGDLSGLKVGAAGGSFITAQVIRLQSEIPFNVIQYDTTQKAMSALDAGEIQSVVMVGGEPIPAIAALNKNYRLLTVPDNIVAKLKAVYRPTRVTYPNLASTSVQTISTEALMITRDYKTPKTRNAILEFRKCTYNSIIELQETVGTHKKWQSVNPENRGKWPYLE